MDVVSWVVEAVDAGLHANSDRARAAHERRYLRSELTHLGVPVPATRRITVAAVRSLGRAETLAVVDALWEAPVHERRLAAVEALAHREPLLGRDDLGIAERLIRRSHTWALVDPLALKVTGPLVVRFPQAGGAALDRYAKDDDFWVRRTALLALLPGIRAGDGDLPRLARYAETMVGEREFFIRKALGWVLRELSKRNPAWVRDWVTANIGRASGVTIREAVRRLADDDRTALLAAHREHSK